MRRHDGLCSPKTFVASALLVALTAVGVSSTCFGETLRDIEYAVVDGISLKLDLYLPDAPSAKPAPLVVYIHGGAWISGDKTPTHAPAVLGPQYAVASVNYRLAQQAPFPAQIHDCKAAVRWLRAHAGTYGIDSNRIGAWGSSAGGHLAALLGTSDGIAALEGTVGDCLGVSSRVQAICDSFGPTDLLTLVDPTGDIDVGAAYSPVGRLLGGPRAEHTELARLASPISHIDETDPPFLILHGDADEVVPYGQSVTFHQVLASAGVDASLYLVGRGAHGGFPPFVDALVKAFFDRVLRP
ncbi:MAG: alpha/beta hydrolase [Candidatus Bipolaricaulota bacterium]|nr:alpha/beta hydrolase [Candidatus Bipolaricaulota bacterium]